MSGSCSPTQLTSSGRYPNNQQELFDELVREASEERGCPRCGFDICACNQNAQEDSDEPVFVKTKKTVPWQRRADKTILTHAKRAHLYCEEEPAEAIASSSSEEPEHGEPDLYKYLSLWELSEPQMIGLCRTFANYLASKQRAVKPPTARALQQQRWKNRKVDIDLVDE